MCVDVIERVHFFVFIVHSSSICLYAAERLLTLQVRSSQVTPGHVTSRFFIVNGGSRLHDKVISTVISSISINAKIDIDTMSAICGARLLLH